MGIKYFRVKGRKQNRIIGTPNIDSLLKRGFSVSKITTIGNKTMVDTFSPKTFSQVKQEYRKNLPKGMRLPF